MNNSGKYAKFIISILGTVMSGLTTYYGTASWEPFAVAALTAATVYLVPNHDQNQPPATGHYVVKSPESES